MNSKLVEAREKRDWTQERAASEIGIDVATLRRWEHGQCKPRGTNKQRLIRVYKASASELGIEGFESHENRQEAQASLVLGSNILETRLLTHILRWNKTCIDHSELSRKLRYEIEETMTTEMNRRKALELLATLPISVFGLSNQTASNIATEEVMPWCVGGITACWHLGSGNDLALASQFASAYLPTLVSIAEQPRYRKTAAALAAQGYLLQTTLAWHISSLHDALPLARQAKHYANIAEDATLQLDALHRLGMVYYYSKQYAAALEALEEAKHLIEHSNASRAVARHLYLDHAAYKALFADSTEAKKSMEKAYKLFSASDDDPTVQLLGYHRESSFLRWEGLTLAHMGQHQEALDSYSQILDQKLPTPERIRVELLINQLASKLKMSDRDMEECCTLWLDAITGAKALQSEQRYNEAVALYEMMQCAWPGEARIAELREHIAHW